MVLEKLHKLSGLVDKERTGLMKKYKKKNKTLVKVCTYRPLNSDTVVEL